MGSLIDHHLRIKSNEISGWQRVAELLSQSLGARLNFAQAAFAYATAIDRGALESVAGEWRGNLLDSATVESVAAMLRTESALLKHVLTDAALSSFG
jgi:hypothetical protein